MTIRIEPELMEDVAKLADLGLAEARIKLASLCYDQGCDFLEYYSQFVKDLETSRAEEDDVKDAEDVKKKLELVVEEIQLIGMSLEMKFWEKKVELGIEHEGEQEKEDDQEA